MWYYYLVGTWPLLNYIKENFLKLNSFQDLLIVFATIIFFVYMVGKIIKRYSKGGLERYLIVFFISTTIFFNYGPIVDFLKGIANPHIKATYIWLFSSSFIVYGAWKISRYLEIQKGIKVLICVVVAIPTLDIVHSLWHCYIIKSIGENNKDNDLNFIFKHKPNIYYILVDAYARQDTLKEVGGFNNEPFLSALEKKGFCLSRNAFSNYHFTTASLSATMNMSYHKFSSDNSVNYIQMHESLKGNNQVRKILRDNAYKIINIPAHWHQTSCHGYEDKCIIKSGYEIFHSFLSTTPFRFIKLKNNYVEFEDIKRTINLFPDHPKFIFVHLAQVHDAIYDEFGNYHSTLHPAFANIQQAQRYISSIKVINKKLLNLIDCILEKDKNSIIVIQSDHGPTYLGNLLPHDPNFWLSRVEDIRLKNKNDFRYAFGILSAIYFSPLLKTNDVTNIYFSGKMSLVNTFRYIFASLAEIPPLPLQDKSFFLYANSDHTAYKEEIINHFEN